jgi:hypothetical protein
MADTPNQTNHFNLNLPTRNITITGESSARMVQNALRVSRLEQRSIQIAMAAPAIRDAGRRAMERLQTAQKAFEAELAQVEKEIEATSRSGGQRRNNRPERQTLSRNQQRNSEVQSTLPQSREQQAQATGKASAKAQTQPQKQNGQVQGGKGGQQSHKAQPGNVPAPGASAQNAKPASREDAPNTSISASAPPSVPTQTPSVDQVVTSTAQQANPATAAGIQSL